jgi:Tol biopolymer transport system component
MLAAYPTSISPDGDTLIGSARPFSARGPTDIFVMDLKDVLSSDDPATEDDLEFLLQSEHNEAHASFSPDGHWIAYDSNESGRDEVYVIPYPYPGPGSKIRVSTDGGRQPRWNPAGGELFYLSGARMMSAAVETDGDFDFENPGEVFQSAALIEVNANNPDAFQYEYSPERQEFLILTDGIDTAEQQHLRVILNWTAELGL